MAAKCRLDVLLVERGLCETRARAQARILAGDVLVDEVKVEKAGTQVRADAGLRLLGDGLRYVSRGGLKLEGALTHFKIDPAGRTCIDVGASTGGFTDVLLQRGAARVYAVDVGYGQLAWSLRQDQRVVVMERTHIAKLEPAVLSPAPDLGVVDVSFISLTRVLEPMLRQLARPCELVCLIKPQFEVGREAVGKGGIVRDEQLRVGAVDGVVGFARQLGLESMGTIASPIQGADGNVEYLAAFRT